MVSVPLLVVVAVLCLAAIGFWCLFLWVAGAWSEWARDKIEDIRGELYDAVRLGSLPKENQELQLLIYALEQRYKNWKRVTISINLYHEREHRRDPDAAKREAAYWQALRKGLTESQWQFVRDAVARAEWALRLRTVFKARVFEP